MNIKTMKTKSSGLPSISLRDQSCKTNGRGLWSDIITNVSLDEAALRLCQLDGTGLWGELRVSFKKLSWKTEKNGLIYTDPAFLKDLRNIFVERAFCSRAVAELDYSEQGMQGDQYVSLDAERHFCEHFLVDALGLTVSIYCGG